MPKAWEGVARMGAEAPPRSVFQRPVRYLRTSAANVLVSIGFEM